MIIELVFWSNVLMLFEYFFNLWLWNNFCIKNGFWLYECVFEVIKWVKLYFINCNDNFWMFFLNLLIKEFDVNWFNVLFVISLYNIFGFLVIFLFFLGCVMIGM